MIRTCVLVLLVSIPMAYSQETKVRLDGQVIDGATGRLLPCRLYVEGPPGKWHLVRSAQAGGAAVPYEKQRGSVTEIHTALTASPFVAELPPGSYRLMAERGKEYVPAETTVRLESAPAKVTLALKRFTDMAARGWYSGDTHVHRTLDELRTLALAEDLNVSFPLVYWVTHAFQPPSQGDKSMAGEIPAETIRVDDAHLIWPRNTEYEIFTVSGKPHTLGALFIIGHRSEYRAGVPPLGPVARQAADEGALLELDKHAWPWSMALPPLLNVHLYELANNHMWPAGFGFPEWGEPSAPYMEIEKDSRGGWTEWGWIDYTFQNYYALLNAGFRMRPTAGTASGVHPVPLGFGRAYVKVEGKLTPQTWLKGLNEGRSFITTGPLLFVTVNGQPPGHTFRVKAPIEAAIEATVESHLPVDRIELVVNGKVTALGKSPAKTAIRPPASCWVAVRAIQKLPGGRIRFAHSSPVFIDIEGRPPRPRKAEIEYLIERVQTEMKRSESVLPAEAIAEYRSALEKYRAVAATAEP
ncbi:MAG: CehA/McbA family metallohydrolase [Bryobacteraceae bacterium]|nr:CehA/McbA family metallohydrolase [Bryobacteraceae bacterium]